ncbi:hypothetical protein RB195_018297 [Necator americanus]|uniref:Uncharacterized protein n=1 Tax=Necator americanus TaxID=51031 RepID=A0ABR1CBE5_NECAM
MSVGSFTTATDFEDWDTIDMCLKMIDDIEQMQGLTVEILEKVTVLAQEMRMVAKELDQIACAIQKGAKLKKDAQFQLSRSINSMLDRDTGPQHPSTTAPRKEFSTSVEDEYDCGLSSHEYDDDLFTEDAKLSTQTLHSLHATANVEQRKNKVISHSLRILGRENVGQSGELSSIASMLAIYTPNPILS